MTREQTFDKLYRMKMHGMAQALEEDLKQPDMAGLSFEERLAMLVDAQWLWRKNRSLTTRLRQAKLKQQAAIEDINFRHPRRLERSLIRSLSACDWVRERHNIAVSGPSGIGKTFLCCALLEKACREGFTALYFRAEKFFRTMAVAYADGSFDKLLSKLSRIDVLAIDDWGVAPMGDRERRHLRLHQRNRLVAEVDIRCSYRKLKRTIPGRTHRSPGHEMHVISPIHPGQPLHFKLLLPLTACVRVASWTDRRSRC